MTHRRAAPAVGMVVFLGSWAMTFAALLFSFGILRDRAAAWPGASLAEMSAAWPGACAVVAIASSALLEWGRRADRAAPVYAAAALAVALVGLEAGLLGELASAGAALADPVEALVAALVGYHLAHTTVGAIGLTAAVALSRRRGARARSALTSWILFWHFVGAAWLAISAAVFLA